VHPHGKLIGADNGAALEAAWSERIAARCLRGAILRLR
jgi:hypothetical protein